MEKPFEHKIFSDSRNMYYLGVLRLEKWEYKVHALKTKIHISRSDREKNPTIQNVQMELNELGDEGWNLVGVQNVRLETGSLFTVAYLKRKKL